MEDLTYPRGDDATWSTPLDQNTLAQLVQACRERDGHDKGRALESLLGWLIPHVRGFIIVSANTWSVDRSQEVDLIVWNDLSVSAFPGLPDRIIVEAKNWDAKVDSTETAWFDWKMRRGNATVGILVAANGVTGNAARREDALAVTYAANEAGRQILLIKLDEIATLDSTEAFYDLLRRKLSALTAIADPFTFGLP